MTLIYSVILCLFFKTKICQLQCVKALPKRPTVQTHFMTEGRSDRLACRADKLCSEMPNFRWERTKADGRSTVLLGDYIRQRGDTSLYVTNILYLTPTADDHNTNITCVADYGNNVVKTTVTLTVEFPPKIINVSQCMVKGKLVVCVCVSRGNPLSSIAWPLASLTDFSVTSSSSIQTVKSTITMQAADYNNTKCISMNKLGQAEIEIPFQNYTDYGLDFNPKSDAVLLWIFACVSWVLLTALNICIYRWGKSEQRERCEEMNIYASLNQADVGQDYSVISPQTRKCPGGAQRHL